MIGRVFRQSASRPGTAGAPGFADQFRDIRRRVARRSVCGAVVTASFYGAEQRVETDRDGYFRIHLRPQTLPPSERRWHLMDLTLEGAPSIRARNPIYIPSDNCRFVVISDIDDTIMKTGVANKLVMLWRLFVQGADSRVAFPGVSALYRALHRGVSAEDEANPMLYVSRAPWGIYDVLDEFFRANAIPAGPVLFLREWGVSWRSPLPRQAQDHKRELITNMLALYDDLPFVLIGDSGQHDPEVYQQIVREHPGRVSAVFIRNVSHGTGRVREIEALAAAVAAAGSTLLVAGDSVTMAEQAVRLGLVAPQTVSEVRGEMTAETGALPTAGPTHRVEGPTSAATAQAVRQGELRHALGSDTAVPPSNVVVEPENRQSR